MFTHAYMIMSAIEIVLVTLLIARYIFLEPKIEKKEIYVCALMLGISLLVYFAWSEELGVLFIVLSSGFALLMARNKHRIF